MDRKKIKEDIVIYALLLAGCGALYFWLTPDQVAVNPNMVDQSAFTPRTFPNLLTGAMAAATALGLILSLLRFARLPKPDKTAEKEVRTGKDWIILFIPYIIYGIIIVYSVLFEKLGYIWATLLIPPVLMFLFGCRKWYLYLCVYGFSALMYVLFKYVLYVPLR